jgi:peptidoglycan/LPS O-acetylase OafA/YrhL
MGNKTIPALTGLRGVAALWVVLFHLMIGGRSIVTNGYLGVDIFFILSGFVLAHVYADRFRSRGAAVYGSFLKARVARIYPLHLVVLGALVLIVLTVPDFASQYPEPDRRFGAGCLAASAVLLQNWFYWLPMCWNGPSWSLSAEWFAYLLFPIFMLATQYWRRPATALCLAGLCLCGLVLALRMKGVSSTNVQGTPGLVRMSLQFACGCLIFRALRTGLKPLPFLAEIGVLAMFAAALILQNTLLLLISFAAIILLAAQNEGLLAKALSTRIAVLLGEISYSIYLVHWMVLQFLNRMTAKVADDPVHIIIFGVSEVALILALSACTYRLIEVPARAWGRKIGTPTAAVLANADAI